MKCDSLFHPVLPFGPCLGPQLALHRDLKLKLTTVQLTRAETPRAQSGNELHGDPDDRSDSVRLIAQMIPALY